MEDDGRVTEAELRRLGLHVSEAVPRLRTIGVWGEEEGLEGCGDVIRSLGNSAAPAQSLRALAELAERNPNGWSTVRAESDHVARLVILAGASDALGELVASDPEALAALLGDLEPWDVEAVRAAATSAMRDAEDAARALTALQRRGLLRVATRDLLASADTPTAAAELSDLAQGVLQAALEHVHEGTPTSLVVIAMGKLGGGELNYVSDVDVMFACDDDREAASAAAEGLLRLVGGMTPLGRTYELDANLRPEGRDGPLVRTLDAFEAYYERWAKTWEFQALMKARPVAGDADVGKRFSTLAERYVWPDRLNAEAVAEIQRMKGTVEHSKPVQRHGERQLKLAPGGLRDIEFAVQLLQLVHGRHDPLIRSPNTLTALGALAEGGYVDEGDAHLFSDAYQFLRTVEHRLQLVRLRRTHTVPSDDAERYRLARANGFRDIRTASALEQFDKEYQRVQGYVRRLHEKLFYRPLLERFAEIGAAEHLGSGEGGLAEEAARDRLAALGFSHPEGALRHLDALASGVSRQARLLRTLLPALLPVLAATPDPDGGLAAFRSLADRLRASPSFLHTLRDNPPVGELLVRVLGASKVLGRWLERQPEVFNLLPDAANLQRRLEPADYRRVAQGLVRRREDLAGSGAALRRMRRREMARIAIRDLGGFADVLDVGAELTGLAEGCLEAGRALVAPPDLRLAVIGLGKLGGGELGYASDLDVLVVFEPAEARDEALSTTEQLLSILGDVTPEGQAFHVDLNLRPEGKDGPLARSLDSYRSYYERWAEPWELQALTLARPVAGDEELGAAFVEMVAEFVFPERPPSDRLAAVRRMKARVEAERADRPARAGPQRLRSRPRPRTTPAPESVSGVRTRTGDRVDLKLGEGGLSDVEWTVQLLQLREGGRNTALRRPGTMAALEALAEADVLSNRDARWLREGWLLLSRVRNALHLAGERDSSVLPAAPLTQEHVARMLGYEAPGMQAFAEDLAKAMRRVRKVHERAFYDA